MLRVFKKFVLFSSEKNKKYIFLSLLLGVFYALCNVLRIVSIFLILDSFFKNELNTSVILTSFLIMTAGLIGMIILKYFMTLFQAIAGYTTGANKRMEIAKHLRYMPMGYYNENSLGYITSVATNTMENLNDIATRVIMMVMDGILDTLLIMVMMFVFDYRMGLIVLAVVIFFMLIQMWHQAVGRKVAPIKDKVDETLVENVLEFSEGIAEVKNYNLVKQASTKIYKSIQDACDINCRMEFRFSQFDVYEGIFIKIGTIAMGLASILLYLSNQITNPAIVIVTIIASFLVFEGLTRAGSYSSLIKNVELCVDKANKILSEEVMNTSGEDYMPKSYDISVKHVSFRYDKKEIIKDISFDIKSGSKLAIVGPSGSGKTTMAKLISRFFDVDKGEITLDGKNIKDYSIDSLMRNFSFVFQNVYLFHDTIKNNIRFGKEDASDEEIINACKKAKCHDFIMSLPDQYDTIIQEGGNSLSGGEKQRLSIARAILKDAPIIILDEATANIDPENEDLIISAFNELTKDKTLIMIAHRLKTVSNADKIIVIDDGRIVEEGKHADLLKNNGIYSRFIKDRQAAISFKIE